MQPHPQGKFCLARRVALWLWIIAQAMSASTLPAQHEARYRVWKLAAESASASDQAGAAADREFIAEPVTPTLAGPAAKPEPPVALQPEWVPHVIHFPPRTPGGLPASVQTAIWILLGAAAAALTAADTHHHRRRARRTPPRRRTGHPIRKPRPPL